VSASVVAAALASARGDAPTASVELGGAAIGTIDVVLCSVALSIADGRRK
jgi:hypothetical protein